MKKCFFIGLFCFLYFNTIAQDYYISACPGCSISKNDNEVVIYKQRNDSLLHINSIIYKDYLVKDVQLVNVIIKKLFIRLENRRSSKVKDVIYEFENNKIIELPLVSISGYNHVPSNDFMISENGFNSIVYCFFSSAELKFQYYKINFNEFKKDQVSPDAITNLIVRKKEIPVYSGFGWLNVYNYPSLHVLKFPITSDTTDRPQIPFDAGDIVNKKSLCALSYYYNDVLICDFVNDTERKSIIWSDNKRNEWQHKGGIINYYGFNNYIASIVIDKVGVVKNDEAGLEPDFNFTKRTKALGVLVKPVIEIYNTKNGKLRTYELIKNFDKNISYNIRILDIEDNNVLFRKDNSVYSFNMSSRKVKLIFENDKYNYLFLKTSF